MTDQLYYALAPLCGVIVGALIVNITYALWLRRRTPPGISYPHKQICKALHSKDAAMTEGEAMRKRMGYPKNRGGCIDNGPPPPGLAPDPPPVPPRPPPAEVRH